MPHHCIERPDSVTTKLRVVFDASCASDTGLSLNDTLLVGPVVQDDLYSMLLRFRLERFAIVADLEKMYRIDTVPRNPQQLAEGGKSQHPMAAKMLFKNFYIDDLLCGVTTEEEGVELYNQLIGLLQSAGFKLQQVPRWTVDSPIIKRLVLSDAARLFDPLGLVGPTVLRSKLFMRQLWLSKLSWDTPLTATLQDTWKEFRDVLEVLRTFSIPRWAVSYADPVTIELHRFCDAFERTYGACLYVRTVTATGSTSVNLLTAKSKVAPTNTGEGQRRISLPRLELSSALLLSHLYDKVKSSFPASTRTFFWTDSMIVVHWLAASPNRWKKFVANRVAEIQQITTPGTRGHVAGIENPADAISRGMRAALLIDFDIWWKGPAWLNQPKRFWPNIVRTSDCIFDADQLEENPATSLPIVHEALNIFKLKSSLTDLVRIVGYIRRFISNAREKDRRSRQNGLLTTVELEMALQNRVRVSQQESFPNDIGSIKSSGQVKPTSKLKSLSPILGVGILRVRGRLHNAPIPYSQKQPMILDSKHPLTLLINRDQIVRLCSDEGIQFRFIPPRSPHFGGIWEAAVKSLKTHLYRTLKNALVTNEQMQTVLTQVEACLNFRPLTQLSDDPEDLDVLTPGHFLVHRPLTAIVEPSYEEIPTNRLSQWQTIQEFIRRLWKRWSSEYLSGLQQRTRWTHERNDVHIGTMVLVKDDHLPPMKWRFGRIVDTTPGPDGHVRVVNIRTKDGIYQRAITRICVLPIQDNQQPHNEV
ncbi:uncharacterized protein LOC131688387 [Topomyia yanbarensis]|uniref:uncharacterized protein LOC131688387 n=1 Tax=Topomyia yanbarensis TaxID=2498891 RepID=UPI00273AB75E|nr:uncharacterized protein LOC131688387 [Topomyia yanbarensis]